MESQEPMGFNQGHIGERGKSNKQDTYNYPMQFWLDRPLLYDNQKQSMYPPAFLAPSYGEDNWNTSTYSY